MLGIGKEERGGDSGETANVGRAVNAGRVADKALGRYMRLAAGSRKESGQMRQPNPTIKRLDICEVYANLC